MKASDPDTRERKLKFKVSRKGDLLSENWRSSVPSRREVAMKKRAKHVASALTNNEDEIKLRKGDLSEENIRRNEGTEGYSRNTK